MPSPRPCGTSRADRVEPVRAPTRAHQQSWAPQYQPMERSTPTVSVSACTPTVIRAPPATADPDPSGPTCPSPTWPAPYAPPPCSSRSATRPCRADTEAAAVPFTAGTWLFGHNGAVTGWPGSLATLAGALPPKDLLSLGARNDSAPAWALVVNRLRGVTWRRQALTGTVRGSAGSRLNLLLTGGDTITATTWGDSHRGTPHTAGHPGPALAFIGRATLVRRNPAESRQPLGLRSASGTVRGGGGGAEGSSVTAMTFRGTVHLSCGEAPERSGRYAFSLSSVAMPTKASRTAQPRRRAEPTRRPSNRSMPGAGTGRTQLPAGSMLRLA